MSTLLRRAAPKQSNLRFPFISNPMGALIFQPSPMQMGIMPRRCRWCSEIILLPTSVSCLLIISAVCATVALGYVSGKKKATIPWAKLSQDPSSWIKPECVPDGFQWADPSKLRIGDVFDLLNHWRQRKQDHLEPLIWVSSCPLLKDVEQPSKHRRAPKRRQGHNTDVGGSSDSSDSESSSTSSSDDSSTSDANHSALPNSDDNSTEDEESENFNLEVSPPHSLSSPQGSGIIILSLAYMKWCLILYIGSFQGGRRYTSTPSSPIDTQRRSTPGELHLYLSYLT